jgi:kumamolisin
MSLWDSSFQHKHYKLRSIYPFLVIPLLALMLMGGSLALYLTNSHAAPPDTLVPVTGSVPAMVARSKLVGPTTPGQKLSLSLGLRLRNASVLKQYVDDISRPKSVNYHRYLSSAQIIAAFSPTLATQNAILSYLQQSGFSVTGTYQQRLLIDFSGTVSQAEQVFHIQINNYTSPKGEAFYANTGNPLLPTSIVSSVQVLSGLNDALRLQHAPLPVSPHHPLMHTSSSRANGASPLFCPSSGTGYYLPGQTAAAYNLNGLYGAGYRGQGQTVALFELDSFQMSDLKTYQSCYAGNSPTSIQSILIDGGPPPPNQADTGLVEVELDAELVLSAAPDLGQLKIYQAPNGTNGFTNYNDEWARILQDSPPVVSDSWGSCESDMQQYQDEIGQENTFFTLAAAQGESIFVASGDSGSSGCYFDANPPTNTALSVEDPASQPFVTAVGGTSLTMSGYSYTSESVWNDPSSGASTGGISQYWTEPSSWLTAPGVQNTYSTNSTCGAPSGQYCREVPDISLNADPLNGYLIYCSQQTYLCSPDQPWFPIGGTSCAAPMWAAMTALMNQKAVKNGGFNLGYITPSLYAIATNSTEYSNDFHDITSGNNDFNGLQNGLYPATTGYDLATGLGSPNAANLASDLIYLAGQRATTPASTTWYFAEGSVGGGFQEFLTLQNPSTSQAATVTITYLVQNGRPQTVTKTVNASTRYTVNVNTDLHVAPTSYHYSVATLISSNIPVVAERPMYFNSSLVGLASGTDVVGATNPGTSYYFSEANSSPGYNTFLTMMNPSTSLTDHVVITYYTGQCGGSGQPACPIQYVTIGPLQRQTANVAQEQLYQKVAIAVTSDNPVVVERPMYVKTTVPNAGYTTGAASEVGATAPGTDWLFAEGYSGSYFQEYLELANFGSYGATVTVKLEYTNGDVQAVPVVVPAHNFVQFDVNNANVHPNNAYCTPSPCHVTTSVSAEVTSDNAIVADRLMFFHFNGQISGITDVVGTPAAQSIYAFAEGYTSGQFTEFLTLQNPTANNETVVVTLFTQRGLVFQQQVQVLAHSRSTLNINTILNPMGSDSVSMVVQALGQNAVIVAERPMYFKYAIAPGNNTQGGTNVIGNTGS